MENCVARAADSENTGVGWKTQFRAIFSFEMQDVAG